MNKALVIGILLILLSIFMTPVIAQVADNAVDPAGKDKYGDKKLDQNEKIDVIVTLNEEVSDKGIEKLKSKVGSFEVKAKGWNEVFPSGFAVTVTRKQMFDLIDDPLVARVDMDRKLTIQLDTANQWSGTTKARSPFPTGYDVTGDRDGSQYRYTTKDVVIAIVDTGIDPMHKDLNGTNNGGTKKVIGWFDVIDGRSSPYDDHGHGTHVASIAAGEGDADTRYKGAAPGAALVGVKVLDGEGSGSDSGVISGVNWVVANKAKYGIRVMSLSLGGSGSSDGTDPLSVALNNAVDKGIVVTVAAGNAGPALYTIASPGAAAKAITVGAMADVGQLLPTSVTGRRPLSDNGFYLATFSSRGPTAKKGIKPDIVAPGVNITAAENTYPNTPAFHGGYIGHSGTSMATPFVAGTVALMLDANYSLTPAMVKTMIRNSAEDYGVSGCDIDYGCGRLRAFRAIGLANGSMPSADQWVPTHLRYSKYQNDSLLVQKYNVSITDRRYPFASTMIQLYARGIWYDPNSEILPGLDLDLRARNPGGADMGASYDSSGQETLSIAPSVLGIHRVDVEKYLGAGYYTLDISKQ